MGSSLAALAMSAVASAAGAPGSTAQASIPPQDVGEVARSYKIRAGSMADALAAFADANGYHLLYDTQLTRTMRTRGLKGRYSPDQGLDRLLSGTGLSYRFVRKGRDVSIILAQAATGTQSDTSPVALPTINVDGGFGGAGPAQNPYNKSYELKDATTGTKTDTPVMETPLNVQAITQQVLRDQQAITLDQALRNVSGVTSASGFANLSGDRTAGLFIRGFRAETFYRDGFRIDSTGFRHAFTGLTQLANIAAVEVLKGPGATLYGLVEPGGIVNVITKEPLNAPYFSLQQQIGSLELYRTTLDTTGPITEDGSLLYRFNMSYENNGAPFGSIIDLTHSQNFFIAPTLKWNIDGATWVKLEAEYSDDRSNIYFPTDPLIDGVFVNIPRSRNYGENSTALQKSLFAALTWSHRFNEEWSVKQQLAFNRATQYFFWVTNYSFGVRDGRDVVNRGTVNDSTDLRTYSTNVDFTGHMDIFGTHHTVLVGGDFYKTIAATGGGNFAPHSFIDLWNPVHPGTPLPGAVPGFQFADSLTQDTAGLYVQDQIELPFNLHAMAGARYQYIRQTNASGETLRNLTRQGDGPLIGQAVTPRFGLLWRPQEWVSLYGNYSQGFGPNAGLVFPGMLAEPTSAESWEGGIKLELFGGKLLATVDYYQLTKTNVPTTDPLNLGFVLLTGAARSQGPEVDVRGEILPGWNVIATYTNQDVRVTQDNNPLKVGTRLPGVPRNLASLWTTYEFQDETLKGLRIGGGYTYRGSQPIYDLSGVFPSTYALLPAWGTVDLMAAYSFKLQDTKFTAQLNINNLFGTTYYTDAVTFAPRSPGLNQGFSFRAYGAPFAVLGSLRAEF